MNHDRYVFLRLNGPLQNIVEAHCGDRSDLRAEPLKQFSNMYLQGTVLNPRTSSCKSFMSLQQFAMLRRSALTHRNSNLLSARRFAFYSQRARLSSGRNDASQKAPLHKPAASASLSQNTSYPAFSAQGLGANRTIKVVAITCLTVAATMESIFWVKVLWAKVSPPPKGESKPEED
jgi:hypothetical protein